jgi:hypothetical protein
MSAPLAQEVLARLFLLPQSLRDILQWAQVQRFLRICRKIWPEIVRENSKEPPPVIPSASCGFLASVLGLSQEQIQQCWSAFAPLISRLQPDEISDDDIFRIHGHKYGIGIFFHF